MTAKTSGSWSTKILDQDHQICIYSWTSEAGRSAVGGSSGLSFSKIDDICCKIDVAGSMRTPYENFLSWAVLSRNQDSAVEVNPFDLHLSIEPRSHLSPGQTDSVFDDRLFSHSVGCSISLLAFEVHENAKPGILKAFVYVWSSAVPSISSPGL